MTDSDPSSSRRDDPDKIAVPHCAGCPFYRLVIPTGLCTAVLPRGRTRHVTGAPHLPPPDWCPLRQADQLVWLRVP